MKLTIWSELTKGGIADYAHDQAAALAARGIEVEMLCAPGFLVGRNITYSSKPVLRDLRAGPPSGSRLVRGLRLAWGILANARQVAQAIDARRPDAVLTHFSEYLSPLWAWRMRRLRRLGVSFHSVLHDPVRDYVVGPRWWHRFSVAEAFSYLETAFVHTREALSMPAGVKIVWVPYGIHPFPAPSRSPADVRHELAIPPDAKLLTSFGYIRDNKNLDLVIRVIAELPELYLVVAGSEQAGGNRPLAVYQALSEELGCADRCRWLNRFISPSETADLMTASDLSLLVYSRSFVSSSAALGVTANYRVPCLISSGNKTTEAIVREFQLGVWVEPDSVEAIRSGLAEWLAGGLRPDWEGYGREHSWARNAAIVQETIAAANPARASRKGDSGHD